MQEDDASLRHFHAALVELVSQDPRCFYRLLDSMIRRHGRIAAVDAVLIDGTSFRHPADVEDGITGFSSRQQGDVDTGSLDTYSTKDQGDSGSNQCTRRVSSAITAIAACSSGSSSSSTSGSGSSSCIRTGSSCSTSSRRHTVLADWTQTQAFLSALLSYRKAIMLLLRGPRPLSMFERLAKGLPSLVLWFLQEGVLEGFLAPPQPPSSICRESSASGSGAAAVDGASVGIESPGYVPLGGPHKPTADIEEVAACRMLTLAVLARVLLTYCQLLPFPSCSTGQGKQHQNTCHGNSSGSSRKGEGGGSSDCCHSNGTSCGSSNDHRDGHGNCSRSSDHCNSSSGSSRGSATASHSTTTSSSSEASSNISTLLASRPSAADMRWLVQLASLGIVCYCLLKQLVQDGIGSSSSIPNIPSSKSSSRSGMSSTATAAAHQKWGGLQLEVPASLLQWLQGFEVEVMGPWQGGWAWVVTGYKRLSRVGGLDIEAFVSELQRQLRLGQQEEEQEEQLQPDQSVVRQMVELLGQLLVLCEEVVRTVQVPLGCNNPNCTSLEGMSEAAAAKVCTGCHKVHYCSFECIKAHWKEHKPFCR